MPVPVVRLGFGTLIGPLWYEPLCVFLLPPSSQKLHTGHHGSPVSQVLHLSSSRFGYRKS